MEYCVRQEANGWTHIDWTLSEGVTAEMIDWHWANMDKTFFLWHPTDHYGFEWHIPVTEDRFVGAIHYTLQTRDGKQDMTMDMVREQGMGLAYLDVADLAPEVADVIVYKHCCVVGARKHGKVDPRFNSIRIHQWEERDGKVVGMSSAIVFGADDLEAEKKRLMLWTKHGALEIGNFEQFLPQLYTLYRQIPNPKVNPYHDLTVEKLPDHTARFVSIKP